MVTQDHGETVTLTEYAEEHNVSRRVIAEKWPKRHPDLWPDPVGVRTGAGRGKPPALYRRADLDRVRAAEEALTGKGVTVAEYAALRRIPETTVSATWRRRYPDVWPEPVGERRHGGPGQPAKVYRLKDLDRVWRVAVGLPEPQGSPADLLTAAEVREYLGVTEGTWRRWWREGRWEPGVMVDGVERWTRARVEELYAAGR